MKKRGGKRKGAGRKKGAPTKTISFRVKAVYAEIIKKRVKEIIKHIQKV